MDKIEININPKDIKGLSYFMGKDEPFCYLRFRFTPSGLLAFCGNECLFGVLRLDSTAYAEHEIALDKLTVKALCEPKVSDTGVCIDNDAIYVMGNRFAVVNTKPLDFFGVIPTTISEEVAQFDPILLERFAKAAKAMEGGAVLVGHNGNNPAIVRFLARDDFVGLLMPLKIREDIKVVWLPDWIYNRQEDEHAIERSS